MSIEKPMFEEFKDNVSRKFTNVLTPKDEKVVFNLWNNRQEITEHLKTNRVKIALHSSVLNNYADRYLPRRELFLKVCHVSTIVLWLSIVAFFISVATGLVIVAEIMFILMFINIVAKMPYHFGEGQKYAYGLYRLRQIKAGINQDGLIGIVNLCAAYVAGQIGLYSTKGKVSWPDYPGLILDTNMSRCQNV